MTNKTSLQRPLWRDISLLRVIRLLARKISYEAQLSLQLLAWVTKAFLVHRLHIGLATDTSRTVFLRFVLTADSADLLCHRISYKGSHWYKVFVFD